MRVLLDIDGVLADFLGGLFLALGIKERTKEVVTWDFLEYLSPRQVKRAKVILKDPLFWRNLEPLPGALTAIYTYKALGHDLIFVTAPYRECVSWGYERLRWVENVLGCDSDDVIITHRKEFVSGHIFIDDKVDNVLKWAHQNPEKSAIVMTAQYNVDMVLPKYINRMATFKEQFG